MTDDLLVAWRGLWRAKGFAVAALLTLALGIAGTTTMFALVRGVVLRPLPVHEQDRLIVAWKELRSSGYTHYPFGDVEIREVARTSSLFERVAGVTANGVARGVMVDNDVASYANGALVTGEFFEVLGVRPVVGRAFTAAEDLEGAERVLVISHAFWRARYGGDADVVGRSLTFGALPFRIIGVMPPDVDYPRGVEVWLPTSAVPTDGPFGDSGRSEIDLLARLRPDVTVEQATAELAALTRQFEIDGPPGGPRGLVAVVHTFDDVVVGDVRPALTALIGIVGLVLLIASANVANLLLARGDGRRAEMAVRVALGAGRGRIVRHVLAESVVLAFVAGALGLATTWAVLPGLLTLIPEGLPRVESVRIDALVIMFTMASALMTAAVAGLMPALAAVRVDLTSQLRRGGRKVTVAAARPERRALVVAQIALAVSVVAVAGLLARSLMSLQSVDTGMDTSGLVFVDLDLPEDVVRDRAQHARFLDEILSQLRAVPGVASATPVNTLPFGIGWDVPRFAAEGQDVERAAGNSALSLESIHPGYFETFGVPIVRGRAFTDADRAGALDVAIVSEDVARRTWPDENPIGKRLKMGAPDSDGPWYTIVGIAAPTRYRQLESPAATLYLPAAQFLMTARIVAVRGAIPNDALAPVVRGRVQAVEPNARVMRTLPFDHAMAAPLARPRFNASLVAVFGTAALLLATVGVYAVMAVYVRQRNREIGIRMALGATPGNVGRLVLREGLLVAGLGAGLGLLGAAWATRAVRDLLFDAGASPPLMALLAALVLVAVSLLAAWIPARRAARVDVATTLRAE